MQKGTSEHYKQIRDFIFHKLQMHFASDIFCLYKSDPHYYFYHVNDKIVYRFNRNP